jgi:hypothetical protein
MARRTKEIAIDDPKSRDHGKVFVLTEKPALDAERWAKRALAAVGRTNAMTGVDPAELEGLGLIGVAAVGVRALATLQDEDSERLMAEMMECVQIRPNSKAPQVIRPLMEKPDETGTYDIEDIKTIWQLRNEVLELHLGFSLPDVFSKLKTSTSNAPGNSSTTQTSPPSSEP